jgi:uncharacterized membrane-anchored protein
MNDLDRLSTDDLTDEQIEAILNTRGFRKMLAYQRLAEGVQVLADEDEIYDSLVSSITKQHSQIRSESSVRDVLDLFREEVETFTEPLVGDDGEQDVELDDLITDEEEAEV